MEPAALPRSSPSWHRWRSLNSRFPAHSTTRIDLAQLTTEGVRLDLGFGAGLLKSDLLPGGELALRPG